MTGPRRLWRELTRPRGPSSHRFYRVGRGSRAGVALLIVLSSLLFISVVGTELTYGASVRLRLAANQRDEAKAEALAETGIHLYRLILVASKGMGDAFGAFLSQFGLGGDALWQMVPFINTGMMRMLLVSGGDVDEVAEMSEVYGPVDPSGGTVDPSRAAEREAIVAESREQGTTSRKRNFLDFDGDFFAEVVDEDSKVFVGTFRATTYADLLEDPTAQKLYGLMSGQENDQFFYDINVDRWELIANLADWTDADDQRLYQGGSEMSVYQNLPDPYRPKNAAFESMAELRLVDGWHRDDIWERFGDDLTIYGTGRINVNSADRRVLAAVLRAYVTPNDPATLETLLREIEIYRSISNYPNPRGFVSHIESLRMVNVDSRLASAITTESNVFRVTSTGQVGDAVVTIEAVIDMGRNRLGEIVYWRVQ